MIDMTRDNTCAPMPHNHFHGNGSCDAMREANKREDRQADAPNGNGARTTGAAAQPPAWQQQDMSGEIAPYYGARELPRPGDSGGAPRQTPADVNHDRISDGYGTEHEREWHEEDGMSSFPQDSFTTPLDADEAARNSWRALLARNVGRNVLVRFLMGTQNLITVEGELYEVGTDYIVIYQPLWDSHITADLYSVKFVEFREPPGVMTLA